MSRCKQTPGHSRLIGTIIRLALTGGLWAIVDPAYAQQHHELGHAYYRNWVNQQGTGCCNNQDCGELADTDVKEDREVTEVRIEGEWCRIQPWMYLKAGNAPNWATNHVCVVKDSQWLTDRRPCSRLLCFQPKPGS
jgi:hypothetical protein